MRAVPESDAYLMAGAVFTALNLLNMLLWAAGLYLPVWAWAAVLLLCLWPALRHQKLNGLIAVGLMVVFVTIPLLHPVTGWDARSIWLFHAKRIYLDGTLYAQLDNYAPYTHNEYPVLVPAIAASLARTMGYWNEIVPRASVAIALAPPLFFAAYLFRSLAGYCAWVSLMLLVCWGELLSGYMDSLVAIHFGLALVAVAEIYRRSADREAPAPTGPAVVLAASLLHLLFLKNEGSVLAGLLSLAVAPAFVRRPKLAWCVVLPWLVFALVWKLPVSHAAITSDLLRNGSLLERGIKRMQSFSEFGLILHFFRILSQEYFAMLAVALVIVAAGWRRLWFAIPSVLVVMGYAAVLFTVFLTTYFELKWHLETAADRVLIAFDLGAATMLLYLVMLGIGQLPGAWRLTTDSGA
ncbi:hypothetical protein [Hydrogenophaga sp. RWCD_12]|uniref:hypothetical protein n=1 Tax=Hydrogenophaga sp. RWCD_12 TaxID=3391190 RepID=UPI0039848C86